MDYKRFLLYTRAQKEAFEAKYAAHLHMLPQYEEWFNTFPLYEWKQFSLPAKSAEFIIGMLCLLKWSATTNFTIKFPEGLQGAALLQREANTPEEFEVYWNKCFKKEAHV